MNPKNQIKKIKYAKSLLAGNTQTKAAIDAGYSAASAASTGSTLAKDPEVQSFLEKAMRQYELGPESYCKEVRKGLDRARIGNHIDYIDRLGALNGIAAKIEENKPVNQVLIINSIKESAGEGFSK